MAFLRDKVEAMTKGGYLEKYHWEPASKMFLDWGMHTDDVRLVPTADGQVCITLSCVISACLA